MPHASKIVLWFTLVLAGCASSGGGLPRGDSSAAARQVLTLLTWPSYFDEAVLRDFEREYDARIEIVTYKSTEDMGRQLEVIPGIDVVVMASHAVADQASQRRLRLLDDARLTNLSNLDPDFLATADPATAPFAVPYLWGTVALLYNKHKISALEPTWRAIFDAHHMPGSFVLLDEMRDMLGVALKARGWSSNTLDPNQIRDAGRLLAASRADPRCQGFRDGLTGATDVRDGKVDLAVVWNGLAARLVAAEPSRLGLLVPSEGSIAFVDVLAISAQTRDDDLAHRFINYVLRAEAGMRLARFAQYATPNRAARQQLPPQERDNPLVYPGKDEVRRFEPHRGVGRALPSYVQTWESLKHDSWGETDPRP